MYKNFTFLDLDGVILDSEERIVNQKEKNKELNWNDFFQTVDWFKLLNESKTINNSVEIIRELENQKRKIAILTKIHTLLEMQAKVIELRENRKIQSPIIFVPPHITKSQICIPSNNEILVDDSIKNIKDWNLFDGDGILFDPYDKTTVKRKVKSLEFLLKE